VKLKVPDSLTRYRVMAVAVLEKQFGEGEATVTARLPLMVRPRRRASSIRRSLRSAGGDPEPDRRSAAGAGGGARSNVRLVQGQGRAVTVPANDRVEVRFAAAAAAPGNGALPAGRSLGQVE